MYKLLYKYLSYVIVAAVLGISLISLRELIACFLPDTKYYYIITVVFVYIIGIVLSFEFQEKITFEKIPQKYRMKKRLLFLLISVVTAIISTILAYLIRYYTNIIDYFRQYAGMVSLGGSVFICSIFSFFMNKIFVFNDDN
ncbi:MAG: GtrA family protein [Agitococcus sp.]